MDAEREAAERQTDATDPRQRGQAEWDDDESRRERARHRDRATPRPREREHAEHDRELLHQSEEALGEQGDAEDLEDAGERPKAAGPVEMQEVAVGDRALQHSLGEDEHEALFHGRPLRTQQPPQRDREHERDDRDREDVQLALAQGAAAREGRRFNGRDHESETLGGQPPARPNLRE